MSPVCHNFVQNAWKKDFCSNCFKSRDEHVKERSTEGSKYSSTPFQNRSNYFKNKMPQSILRLQAKKKSKRNVTFPVEVSSVIGYGGDDWSDDEEFQLSEDIDDEDTFPETEEEKELHRITKCNTDFNTVKANLLGSITGEAKKVYTSLLLGKMQTDSDGKKKTLTVSVTPFGQENKNVKSHNRKAALLQLSNQTAENQTNGYKTNIILSSFIKENEIITVKEEKQETKSEMICTEKSLLEEISETLEQNRISSSNLRFSQANFDKPTVVEEQMKVPEKLDENESEKKETNEATKKNLVRNSPVIKTQERPKFNSRSEFKFCKINITQLESNSVDSAISVNTNASFQSDDESFGGRTDSDNDDSGTFSENLKLDDDSTKFEVVSDKICVDTVDSRDAKNNIIIQTESTINMFPQPYQSKILDMPPIIPITNSSPIFSAEASRELAGEPDGRADPEEPAEAPALPSSPIPNIIETRPSFLHGMISEPQNNRPVIPEKPKVPIKPTSVFKPSKKNVTQSHQIVPNSKTDCVNFPNKQIFTEELNNEITEIKTEQNETIYLQKVPLSKQDSDSSINGYNKRKAPMPPPSPTSEESITSKYQRKFSAYVKSDSPVVREKEKRERASFSPKNFRSQDNGSSNVDSVANITDSTPEPAPRKNISLSHDNLLMDDKRKAKYKFSIKKLLRIGSSKDLDRKDLISATVSKIPTKPEEIYDLTPKPKPRLVIIHPLDINGSSVEVVKSNNDVSDSLRRLSHDDTSSIYSASSTTTDSEVQYSRVVNKPPPPPRTVSENKNFASNSKPARPPPPKSVALQLKQKQQDWTATQKAGTDNIYANLGEVRSAIAPRKPERTASMREREAREAQLELPKRRVPLNDEKDDSDDASQDELVQATNDSVIHNYDDVYHSAKYDSSAEENTCESPKNSDSDYEYVNHNRSSSPECDSGIEKAKLAIVDDSCYDTKTSTFRNNNIENESDFVKYNNSSYNRTSSLPYCGSETESEIYSPYSFYSATEMDHSGCNGDYSGELAHKNTTSKLRIRKGRSVVHRNLEDNYGAVVIANHEALAQVLEQVQQSAVMLPSLRGLKASTNLRWSDFTLTQTAVGACRQHNCLKAGKRVFYQAVWNPNNQGAVNVTLMLHKEQISSQIVSQQSMQPQTLCLNAITEFCDLVPLQHFGEESDDLVQATIVVLAHTQVDTIQSFGECRSTEALNSKEQQLVLSDHIHEATFMMLQLINGLKCLQARGVEEIPESLMSFVILKETQPVLQGSTVNLPATDDRLSSIQAPKTNSYGRLCILQGLSEDNSNKPEDEKLDSLCKCAVHASEILLPGEKLTALLKDLLQNERAVSLSQAKSVLEFTLWGPLDVVQGVPLEERELSLQRWLDLERATVLHGLVRTRVQLNAFEQLHLMFLVRSSAKMMCDASILLERANVY